MLKIIAVGIVTYITYPIVVEHGLYPDGIPFALLYGAGVVGVISILEKRIEPMFAAILLLTWYACFVCAIVAGWKEPTYDG